MRRSYFLIWQFFLGFILLISLQSFAQPTVNIQNKKDACDALSNGSFEILVTVANDPPLDAQIFGPPNQGPFALTVGVPFTVSNLPGSLAGRNYVIVVQDADGSTVLNVTIFGTPANLTASVGSTTDNMDCSTPNGTIDMNVAGGSGSGYTYQWTGPVGFVDPGTEDLTGLIGGDYTFTVFDNGTNCFRTVGPITITDPLPIAYNVSASTPSVCLGNGGTVNLSNSDAAIVSYEVYRDGVPTGIIQPGTNAPLAFAIPAGLLTPVAAYTFTIEATNGFCPSVFMNGAAVITVSNSPTITLGAIPSVCSGVTSSTLSYSATTDAPDQYRIDWDGTAEAAGFVDVANSPLPASPIPINGIVATPGTYNGTLYVTNTVTSCESVADPISVTVDALPTITLGANPTVCIGTTSTVLPYSATTSSPNQFRIDWDTSAEGAGLVDVGLTALPASLIPISGLPVVAGTYNGTLFVRISGSGCESIGDAFSVTVDALPTITMGANPIVCSGTANSSISYSATTGTPDQFRIDWDNAAEIAGFVDVPLGTLPVSPIPINGIPATPGVYNGTLFVLNSGTTCESTGNTITVTVEALPTISLDANPEVCIGTLSSSIGYSATTGTPDQFRIDWDGAAEAAGLVDVVLTALPASPIPLNNIPATAGTYNGTLFVLNSGNGCESVANPISVTVTGLPTITLGANPLVCQGATTANLTYSATTNSPDQFRIDWDVAAEAAGLVDVVATALPASPIVITGVPGATGTYNGTLFVINSGISCESSGDPISITVSVLPTITLGANPTVCSGTASSSISYSATTDTPDQFRIDWDASAEAAGLIDVGATALPVSPIPINNIPIAGGTYNGNLFVIISGTGCESIANPISVTVQAVTATLSGNPTSCAGSPATLTVTFTGPGPTWDFTYSDGFSNFMLTATSSPFNFTVNPIISTTYSMVSVIGATCGAGTVSGTATVTVAPIAGNPATFGNETWIGYVYDDSGSPAPPASNIDFNNTKYRGFLSETEMAAISPFSSYNTTTDAFNLNLSNTVPVAGTNICGSYLNDYSIRFRMTKTFAAGVYTFTVGGDDGVRMFIDGGANILTTPAAPASFSTHAFTTYTSAPQCLTAGTHNLVIEYFDRGGFSRIDFNYSTAAAPAVTTPVSVCVNSPAPTLTASSPGAVDYNWYTDATLTNPPIFMGANYVPAPTELDMSVVGMTDFFVTAVYACGETPAAQVTVDVTSGAVINVPPAPFQVCDVGGVIDLTTIISATPMGGAFTFSGTGITVSPNFDPAGLGGTTSTIMVSYVAGTCMASTSFDIDIVTNATISVPVGANACESAGIVDLNMLVGGNPTGGGFTYSGTGVIGTGPNFDPTGLTGLQTITVDYNVGGCVAPTQMFDINVVPNVSLAPPVTSVTVCPSDPPFDLNLIPFVTANPSGGLFNYSGTGVTGSMFDPSLSPGTTVNVTVNYDLNGCLANAVEPITVLPSNDPLCGGGGVNCSAFNVVVNSSRPTCSSQDDGTISLIVTGGTPNYVVTLSDGASFSKGLTGTGPFNFTDLSPANYSYTITDNSSNTCTLPFSLPLQTGLSIAVSNVKNESCLNQGDGSIDLSVVSGGTAPFEYSLDGISGWTTFVSPVTITGFVSKPTPYDLFVRQNVSDLCPATTQFTIAGAASSLDTLYVTKTISVPDLPTGSMIVGISESLQEPYEVRLELTNPVFPGQVFAQDFTVATRNPLNLKVEYQAPNLFAGGYLLSLRDALGCRKDYQVTIDVDNNLMIPNIFTPNGDGVNEVFFIRNMPEATEVTFTNRWGKQVYSSKNYQNDWDGGDTSDGVYYYRINAAGQSYSGWVEILRGK